jgi:LacI family transcriptional regulator
MTGPHRPTQSDVAKLAGVSQALVSYVLNSTPNLSIPVETRRRILDAIEQLGYVPDRSARNLRTRRSNTIAVIIPDITNPYHPAFARSVQDVAEAHGFDLIIYNTDGLAKKEEKVLRSVLHSQVDGVIGIFFNLPEERFQQLIDRKIAVVQICGYREAAANLPVSILYLDMAGAARTAVEYLIEKGHRQVAHVCGIAGTPHTLARIEGYQQALAQHGLGALEQIAPGDFSVESGYSAMQSLLAGGMPPTAVFCSNDLMAVGAIHAIIDAGLRVPQDIAVVGFDNIDAATMIRPQLTTIDPFKTQVGKRAAELLIQRIQTDAPFEPGWEETPFRLVIRQSS